ncbi:hypothetical protein D5074_05985 [Pectobacterium polaris]|nr:hypothetical protein D5074_05985 [Pectobacterium polaris]
MELRHVNLHLLATQHLYRVDLQCVSSPCVDPCLVNANVNGFPIRLGKRAEITQFILRSPSL